MIVEETNDSNDPLSRLLNSLSFSDWRAGETILELSSAVVVPAGYVSFYVVRSGHCRLSVDSVPKPVGLSAGDGVLLAHGTRHALQAVDNYHDSATSVTPPFRQVFACDVALRTLPPRDGATLVFGHVSVGQIGGSSFKKGLPKLWTGKITGTDETFRMVTEERQSAAFGRQAIIDQLVRLLFIKALRSIILNSASTGTSSSIWYAATADPLVGPVLALIHSQPQNPWTVSTLAREVDMSRSAFSERFRDAVGRPPLQYVTEVRMQKACDLLGHSELGIKEIASLVGYESSSSFTTVFKRWTGLSPARYRKRGNSPPQDLKSSSRESVTH